MDFFKGTIKSLTPSIKAIAKNTSEAIVKNTSKITATVTTQSIKLIKSLAEEEIHHVVQIEDRVYWMAYPTKDNIEVLVNTLNDLSKGRFYIWNISEFKYDTSIFNNNVAEFNFVGYPCPPLCFLFSICKNIMEWLNADRENIAVMHCNSAMGRTALQVSCLLTLMKKAGNPFEAFSLFCAKLGKNDNSVLGSSQHKYLTYFSNILGGIKLNPKVLVLEKIILSEVPIVAKSGGKDTQAEAFRPYIQVFRNSKIIHNDLLPTTKPVSYSTTDLSIWFDIKTEVEDDFLIRCRHYRSETERVSAFRIFANTGFVLDDVLRLKYDEIDIASDIEVSKEFFIDLVFKKTETDSKEIEALSNTAEQCKNYELVVWEQPVQAAPEKKENEEVKELEADTQPKLQQTEEKVPQHEPQELPSDTSTNTSVRSEGEQEKIAKVAQLISAEEQKDEDKEIDDYISRLEKESV